ncbi:hypothetical protein [Leeuwenhoekiella nanhaiensis]|uniref:Glycosyltransferase RgtA/B/C/D-like domain-containing protein n=1 Tax=Leeuwenhoekiella nanhaiensis TaxID=1655491 RepID=A0A2G1VPE4_9FLAO|nr:hypothetical protein [Leeuwenhoekiella nanhaiensis]PHQ28638.1 hypothetical protein CJ305_14105 [Leeuwenhoekiella nanhaiensis]
MKKVHLINLLIISVLILHLFLKSYFHHDGRISPDSAEYLSAAQALINGEGLYTGSNPILGLEKSYFSIWPAGYPLLIAFVSFITTANVFWASKLVNALMLLACAFLLKSIYKRKSFLFIACFGFASYLFLFSSTYSEVPFTFSLIYLSWSLYNFTQNETSWVACIHLALAAILPFLFRYIGVFTCFLLLGLLLKSFLENGLKSRTIRLLVVFSTTVFFEVTYLSINFIRTGNLTGISRPSKFHEPFSIMIDFAKGMLGELVFIAPYFNVFLMLLTMSVSVLAWLYIRPSVNLSQETRYSSQYFLLVGICYFFSLLIIGYLLKIKTFDYRFLGPGSLLILFGIIDFFLKWKISFLKVTILSFLILSLCFSIRESYHGYSVENRSYLGEINYLQKEVSKVEEGSILIEGNKHYKYLRPDLIIFDSWYLSDTIPKQRLKTEYPEKKIYFQEGKHILRVY